MKITGFPMKRNQSTTSVPARVQGFGGKRPGSGRRWLALGVWMVFQLILGARLQVTAASFTYQGRLTDGSTLPTGSYDFTFKVYDALTSGTQVGSAVALSAVGVTNGVFTVALDFGDGVFTGANRWLEMSARTAGTGTLEVFTPRQPITSVPYALYALASPADAATTALTARVAALESMLSSGITATSLTESDSSLLARGFIKIGKMDATGWVTGTTTGLPTARYGHAGVWTGSRLLIWGGIVSGSVAQSGASYDPGADEWTALPTVAAPSARSGQTAVWTGSQMVIWGGTGGGYLDSGASYSPTAMAWTSTASSGVPAGRSEHVAVWTGGRMVVWGGRNASGLLSDGGSYDVGASAWTALPTANAPAARRYASAVWTGSNVIVFGGEGSSGYLASGATLPFTSSGTTAGAWQALATLNAPSARALHTAVWTGSKMIVWGGKGTGGSPLSDGASYNPTTGTWSPLSSVGAPAARHSHVAQWTGAEMLILGGETAGGTTATGAAYDPATDQWRTLPTTGNPVARSGSVGVWSGSELIVFGGLSSSSPVTPIASLQRLNPQPTWYLFRKP